jgi:hypothetical protein
MSRKELDRYEVIQRLINGDINSTKAAKLLLLSIRHIKHLKTKVKTHGPQGVQHGHKGKKSNNAMKPEKILSIESLIRRFYPDFGPTLATEKLAERHNIQTNKESVRKLMINYGLWKPKPRIRNKEYRSWRPRKEHYGEMVQFDGSYHHWFEERAPACCLLGAIDDATGKLTKLQFTNWEGVVPAYCFWREYVELHGKPVGNYPISRFLNDRKKSKHRVCRRLQKQNLHGSRH